MLVVAAQALGRKVIVRHNLTVTLDPHPLTKESMADLPDFFAAQNVEIVSSLPYYQEYFTDKQRGDGVFQKSITSLKLLNAKGFGIEGSGRLLNLVYNPVGPFLPPAQAGLEADYRKELRSRFGIEFNTLFALANMPIHRFKAMLKRLDTYEEYMEKLVGAFNPEAAANVMCRSMISVSHDGTLYDCDFNQMLKLPLGGVEKPLTIHDFDAQTLMSRRIVLKDHCFGCTAGAGSSCGGATAAS
jgi:radical SAM/Cys-rich protein